MGHGRRPQEDVGFEIREEGPLWTNITHVCCHCWGHGISAYVCVSFTRTLTFTLTYANPLPLHLLLHLHLQVRFLVSKGAQKNAVNEDGFNAITWAAYHGRWVWTSCFTSLSPSLPSLFPSLSPSLLSLTSSISHSLTTNTGAKL